jgi:hypothetical protein
MGGERRWERRREEGGGLLRMRCSNALGNFRKWPRTPTNYGCILARGVVWSVLPMAQLI